jgi:hypothetical protein
VFFRVNFPDMFGSQCTSNRAPRENLDQSKTKAKTLKRRGGRPCPGRTN